MHEFVQRNSRSGQAANRKNSLFYRAENGARVGGLFMSPIHTCERCGANPFEYLTQCLSPSRLAYGFWPGVWAEGKLRAARAWTSASPPTTSRLCPWQSRAMREYAARRGWSMGAQVREVGSGASQRELRGKVLDAARRRDIGRSNEFPIDGNRGRRAHLMTIYVS